MKEADVDAEKIAALLAGTLGETERAAVLARLASSGDDFRLFMETAEVLREIEEAESKAPRTETDTAPGAGDATPASRDGVPAVTRDPSAEGGPSREAGPPPAPPLRTPPSARPRWRRPRVVAWIALAAAAAAVVVLLVTPRRPPGPAGLAAAVAMLTRPGVPAGMAGDHPWRQTMGGSAALAPQARAARVGALHTELALAARARDTATAARVVAQIEAALAGESLAATAIDGYRRAAAAVGSDPARAAVLLTRAGEDAAVVLDEQAWMEAGAWAEAGRIAAAERDTAFFSAPATGAALKRTGRLNGLSAPARQALQRVRAELHPGRPRRWDVLEAGMRDLLAALAS